MNIDKIFGIFNELENQSAKTAKEQILKDNEGDMEFREALTFLLNPYIVTGLSTKKIYKKVKQPDMALVPTTFDAVMSYLRSNNTGRDLDIYAIQKFISKLESEDLQLFVEKFVTKDLKIGISEKTVNKVYGKGTIPSFAVMLAESYEKKADKVKGKFYITLKLDGNRCICVVDGKNVKFYSRKGQPIDGMIQLEKEMVRFPNGVYDGELLLVNDNNLPSDELFRATQKVVRKDGEKKDLEFYIFDHLSIDEFKEGKSKKTYEQRRNTLNFIFSEALSGHMLDDDSLEFVSVLPVLYEGTDKTMVTRLMVWAEENGHEGLMVNTADGLYQSKRTTDLLKVKTMKTADLLVMNVEKAIDGQFKGLLGRVNVEYKGNLVGVGSGFTLEQRREFIENPDLIAGKIIEVQYFEESKDEKTGQPSLRFPVFKGIRHDKGVDDINYGE